MTPHRPRFVTALAAAAIFTAFGGNSARAMDGTASSRFEIAVFWGSNRPSLDTAFAYAFVPVLIPGGVTGSGSQSLALIGRRSSSFNGAAACYLNDTVGFQILGTAFTTGLSGANAPYRIALNKPSRNPGLKPGVFLGLILSGALTPV